MHEPNRAFRPTRAVPGLLLLWTVGTSCDVGAQPGVAGVSSAEAAVVSAVDDDTRAAADKHAGRWAFSGGQAERDAVKAAIDDVVSEMNPLARGIARSRLQEANEVPDRITIERDGDKLVIAFDDRRYAAPLDGSKTRVDGITGDKLDYRINVSAERIRQSFQGDKGGRRNVLRRRGEHGLKLDVKVSSKSLPKPLEYRLSFRRSE